MHPSEKFKYSNIEPYVNTQILYPARYQQTTQTIYVLWTMTVKIQSKYIFKYVKQVTCENLISDFSSIKISHYIKKI